MYYITVIIAVILFGGGFALSDVYRRLRSSSIRSSLESSLIGAIAGLTVLLAVSGGFQATPFTLFIAFLSALNSIAFMFFSFKALDCANLSVYSLFSMLGGMALPFFQGIIFYGENLTVAKLVAFLLITVALTLTVSRGRSKNGIPYYIGVFILNGMSGALSKIFTSSPYEKTSPEWFSVWIAFFTAIVSLLLLLTLFRKSEEKFTLKALAVSVGNGLFNRIANMLLVVALVHIDASVQYTLVTGGVIIVSTVISLFGKSKPSKKELLSVAVAFLGTLALFLIKA
ncbi:MAG: hypothetical protein IJP16_06700 [Clostridia bacterium]|nr:hypothetical protein [Clostridia bacterium]